MPVLDAEIKEKIENLRTASRNWSEKIAVYEILKINWTGEIGVKCYGKTYIPEGVIDGIEVLPKLHGEPDEFFVIEQDSSLSDSEIEVEIWDGGEVNYETNLIEKAGEFADLVHEQGEGIPCEIFLWFPAEELLLSVWQGHLRSEESSDAFIWRGKIANGFRSPNLNVPSRAHYASCSGPFGGWLETQDEIDENPCPYNAHIGGVIGTPGFEDCDRKSLSSCTARGIDPHFHFSHFSSSVTILNSQSKGSQLYSISRGNESNLKESVRVIMGTRKIRDCQVLAFRRDYNNNTPAHGWFAAIYEVCEGPVAALYGVAVNRQNANPLHYNYRLGDRGQGAVAPDLNTHGYSGTALFRYNYGWVDPGTVGPDSMRGEAYVVGLNNIRIYSDEDTFTRQYTANRAWHIAEILCNKKWGLRNDYTRLNINSWIVSANWGNVLVRFTELSGGVEFNHDHIRSTSNVELVGRSAQSHLEDMCKYGRLTRPYLFQNKLHLDPLRPLTDEELEDCPVFTDKNVSTRNIIIAGDKSTLTRSTKSDMDIPNRLEGTINDPAKDYMEAPLDPVEDVEQQFKAGRVQGDLSRRQVTKKHSLLGITIKEEGIKILYWLLFFGEFGEGGIKNNLQISFKIFVLDALDLHEYKIIKVESDQLERYGFEYFRIQKMKRESNLYYTIEASAYNHEDESAFETAVADLPEPPESEIIDPLPEPIRIPREVDFASVNWVDGVLNIKLQEVV